MQDKPIIKLNDISFPTNKPSSRMIYRMIYLQEVARFEIKWPRRLPETYFNEIIIGEFIDLCY